MVVLLSSAIRKIKRLVVTRNTEDGLKNETSWGTYYPPALALALAVAEALALAPP